MFSFLNRKYRDAETKLADIITRLSGSMVFVYLHILAFTLFFLTQPFQIEVFNILLSLEAVFLATFVLINQNRQAEIFEEREEEEEAEQEEIQEDIEDIQQDFDELQKDLGEVRRLIEKIEARASGQEPLPIKTTEENHKQPELVNK
jgi:uncharacterized membrane protein